MEVKTTVAAIANLLELLTITSVEELKLSHIAGGMQNDTATLKKVGSILWS